MAEERELRGITRITVSGFKSLRNESHIEVRPLTILAGANSSGKSSIMQPLLLMKQTLEAPYDPGPLKLDGPNVWFTSAEQFLSRGGKQKHSNGFTVGFELHGDRQITNRFQRRLGAGQIELVSTDYEDANIRILFGAGMTEAEIEEQLPAILKSEANSLKKRSQQFPDAPPEFEWHWRAIRNRCFVEFELYYGELSGMVVAGPPFGAGSQFPQNLHQLIHIPGYRGHPERAYPATPAVGPSFEGTFDNYVASIIAHWQESNDERLSKLRHNLGEKSLKLTSIVVARRKTEVDVELLVGRLPAGAVGNTEDVVNIADVGFGVSQVLPVLVALIVAEPGQLVYLEQPELHLHPRAQVALAEVLADAAKRGVRVVAETHSSLLLLGIQTLVAKGELSPDIVALHWFKRGEDGVTKISTAELDENGAYGDWPEDFGDVELKADSAYLDAIEARRAVEQ